jgi:hypothetical protein
MPLHIIIVFGVCGPPDLHLGRRLRASDNAVQHDPRIPGKINGLTEVRIIDSHKSSSMTSGSAPADPRRPVTSDGTDQKNTRPDQPVEDDLTKRRLAGRYY